MTRAASDTDEQTSIWRATVRKPVLAHNPIRKNAHPYGGRFAYCVCGEAIVELAGVYWHLRRDGSLHENGVKAPERSSA